MKVKALTWDELQAHDQKQTAVIVNYEGAVNKGRIFVGNWTNREVAWMWCKRNNVKSGVTYTKSQQAIRTIVSLKRLDKVVRMLAETRPKNVSAYEPWEK